MKDNYLNIEQFKLYKMDKALDDIINENKRGKYNIFNRVYERRSRGRERGNGRGRYSQYTGRQHSKRHNFGFFSNRGRNYYSNPASRMNIDDERPRFQRRNYGRHFGYKSNMTKVCAPVINIWYRDMKEELISIGTEEIKKILKKN